MNQSKIKFKSGTTLLLSISLIIAFTAAFSISVINWRMKTHARYEARQKAMLLLDHNYATHTYFSHQLKPALFKKIQGDGKYFEPVWMSSTYAIREIDNYYHSLSKEDYYYKEAAINARSPANEADVFERAFIEKLNNTPELMENSEVRTIHEEPFLVVLRRGETMEQNCLRCHSTPQAAPAELLDYYGPDRSFRRSVGEVVSAISIRIPLGAAYANVNRLIVQLSALFGASLLIAFGLTIYLGKKWVFSPLSTIRKKALEVSRSPEQLGEQIELPASIELSEVTRAFNDMSSRLRQERDLLESRVAERTEELKNVNLLLRQEVDNHKATIKELESTLKEIRTLRGILPICSHCKKIRNDEGYWDQIESYIQTHTEADFSHSICPGCVKRYYSNYISSGSEPAN